MGFAVTGNSTGEELFTTSSQAIPESHFEEASHSSHAGGLWTTETMDVLTPIVTDSLWEQAVTAGLLILFWLYVNIFNGTLFYVLRKEYSLHTPQYMVLVSYMVCDVLSGSLTLLHMVPVVISNDLLVMPPSVSRILVAITTSCGFPTFHSVGLMAYERYCYFATPLQFTKKRIYVAVAMIYSLALCMVVTLDLISPRIPVATALTYLEDSRAIEFTNILYACLYAIPSGLMSVITLVRLGVLISKHRAQVQKDQSAGMSEDQSAVSGLIIQPVKKALKMVGLVSCSLWLTTIPGFLIRIGLSASGVTWADTDQRISLSMFALARTSFMMLTVISSVLNPIIYVSVLPELRVAVWKCFRIKRNDTKLFLSTPTSQMSTTVDILCF